MPLLRCASALVLLASFAVAAHAQTEKTFPTDDEINLLLTQTERALQQYKPLIDQEVTEMGKDGAEAAAKDRELANNLEVALKAFRGKPQGFNGPLGFAFFAWLDDLDRNTSLCESGALSQAMLQQCTPAKVLRMPHFPHLRENNVRKGFLEDSQYRKLVEGAELWFRTIVECGRTYGWRISELLGMKVKQVDLMQRSHPPRPRHDQEQRRTRSIHDGCAVSLAWGLCGRQGSGGCRIYAAQRNPRPHPPRCLGKGLHSCRSRAIRLRRLRDACTGWRTLPEMLREANQIHRTDLP